MSTTALTVERTDILESLRKARYFLRHTAAGLTEEQARTRSTVSELTVGGLVKHVAATELGWQRFITEGPASMIPDDYSAWADDFRLTDADTLDGVLARYAEIAAETDRLVATTDLDAETPLPEAPWFEAGAAWTARRVFQHLIAETAQHAGHADIIRESIDGQKSMG
ncbi:DinB family protein [Actinokineospora guangxiensis]|uniref:DinB family protein n=1 Tax=Actinokineospora guangxiensis TaxID=1490288 RepID=A0ABW0EUJ4_9PSEU